MPLDPPESDHLRQWLALCLSPGAGPVAVQQLLRAFGPPEAVLAQPQRALAAVVGERLAAVLRGSDARRDAAVAGALEWACAPARHLITLADPRYPASLLRSADPPPLVYVDGDPALLDRPMLAIVGSRSATAQGRETARAFSRTIADAGFTIVSGLALGIDAAAHEGALASAAGTVAVLGTGIDVWYPPANRELAAAIADHGCLVSELPPGTAAAAGMFPRRNRLIAGLAVGVLVVEAARRSGSLITARLAAELGRDVFAVPGSIHSPLSKGCHQLIREGARLIESAQEVLEDIGRHLPKSPTAARAPAAAHRKDAGHGAAAPERAGGCTGTTGDTPLDRLLDSLGFDPADIDTLCARSGLDAAEVAARLSTCEIDGSAERLADGRWMRRP